MMNLGIVAGSPLLKKIGEPGGPVEPIVPQENVFIHYLGTWIGTGGFTSGPLNIGQFGGSRAIVVGVAYTNSGLGSAIPNIIAPDIIIESEPIRKIENVIAATSGNVNRHIATFLENVNDADTVEVSMAYVSSVRRYTMHVYVVYCESQRIAARYGILDIRTDAGLLNVDFSTIGPAIAHGVHRSTNSFVATSNLSQINYQGATQTLHYAVAHSDGEPPANANFSFNSGATAGLSAASFGTFHGYAVDAIVLHGGLTRIGHIKLGKAAANRTIIIGIGFEGSGTASKSVSSVTITPTNGNPVVLNHIASVVEGHVNHTTDPWNSNLGVWSAVIPEGEEGELEVIVSSLQIHIVNIAVFSINTGVNSHEIYRGRNADETVEMNYEKDRFILFIGAGSGAVGHLTDVQSLEHRAITNGGYAENGSSIPVKLVCEYEITKEAGTKTLYAPSEPNGRPIMLAVAFDAPP